MGISLSLSLSWRVNVISLSSLICKCFMRARHIF